MEKTKITPKRILGIILLLASIGGLIFAGIRIFAWNDENDKTKSLENEARQYVRVIEGTKEQKSKKRTLDIDFAALKDRNPDTVAWLRVAGTSIDTPVVQTNDNDFYLSHTFDRSDSSAGWAFLDYRDKLDVENETLNQIIYAHYRLDGSLFAELYKLFGSEWQGNSRNNDIILATPEGERHYKVFSIYHTDDQDKYIRTSFKKLSDYEDYLKHSYERSEHKFKIKPKVTDRILTLSTCNLKEGSRTVVQAVLQDK